VLDNVRACAYNKHMNKNTAPPVKASRAHPLVKRVIAATFPEYRGRLIRVQEYRGPQWLTVCWDEGSRDSVKLIDLRQGVGTLTAGAPWTNEHGVLAHVDQPEGSILVVHSISAGRDRGLTITVRQPKADDLSMLGTGVVMAAVVAEAVR
jgi:hypothetical protein